MKGGLGTPPCPLGSLWEALGTGPLSCRPVCGQRSLQRAGPHHSGPHMSAPSSAHCLSEMWAASESMMSSSSCRLSERSVGSLETCGGGQRPRMQPSEDHGLLGGGRSGQRVDLSVWLPPAPTAAGGQAPVPHTHPGLATEEGSAACSRGGALTLVNWCTMMCRQCRFMSRACVLSAASRICNIGLPEVPSQPS